MDALNAVEAELEQICSKLQNVNTRFMESVTHLINFINILKKRIDDKVEVNEAYELTEDETKGLAGLMGMVRVTLNHTSVQHRSVHPDICKVGREIDRGFNSKLEEITRELIPNSSDSGDPIRREKLNQAVCEHLYREGMHDVGESLLKEARMNMREGFIDLIGQQHQILDALKLKDLGPAIDWVSANREALNKISSNLEFELHRLGFLLLVEAGTSYQEEAVRYARENLSPFTKQNEPEIRSLMGSLIYGGENVRGSPYAYLFDGKLWDGVYELFQKDSCKVLEIPIHSPLSVCVATGCTAVRTRTNILELIKNRQSEHYWNSTNGLPVDTRLGEEFQYHSIFACPILRNQTTDENLPRRLPCGHVISSEAMVRLVLINRNNTKQTQVTKNALVKCPYCPVQEKVCLSRIVKF